MITLAVLVALAALVDRAPAAPAGFAVPPPHPVQRRIHPVPYEPHVPACAACVCAPARLPGTLLPRTVAGRCRGRPGCARHEMYLHPKMEMTFRKRHVPIRDPIMWKKEENLRVSTEENISHMLDLRMCFKRASGFDFSSTKT